MIRAVCLAGLPVKGNQRFLYASHGKKDADHPTLRDLFFRTPPLPMAVTKAQKTEILAELKDKLQKSKSIMFAHYIGMTVADVSELRSNLKKQNAEMKVAKKTLMQLAAKEFTRQGESAQTQRRGKKSRSRKHGGTSSRRRNNG